MDLVFSVTLKHPCLSHSHCLWYVCLMLIWNSLHIYHPSLKALGNRTQCHCRSRKTVKQIYVHACWWEKGGGRGGKNDLFTTFSPWETSLFFSLWLNKLFINVKSCLAFGSSPRTRHPWTMWMPAAGPEGQQGDQAEILKTDVGVCLGSICFPLCDFFFSEQKDEGNKWFSLLSLFKSFSTQAMGLESADLSICSPSILAHTNT